MPISLNNEGLINELFYDLYSLLLTFYEKSK